MKKCDNCQKEFSEEANFCNQCGSPLTSPTEAEMVAEQPLNKQPEQPVAAEEAQENGQPEAVPTESAPPKSEKKVEDITDEFYQKSKETIKNVGNSVNGFIDKADSDYDNSGSHNQARSENYGLYYVKIFRVLIIVISILTFLVLAYTAFATGFYNPIAALFGLFGAVISACLTYFILNFSLKMFENLARIGRNILDIRNMMMAEQNKKNKSE